jgi:hypothetical protein
MVSTVDVYIDESGTHDGSTMIVVGGYIFRKEKAEQFSQEWLSVLDRYGVSHFHMTDCANGQGHYKGWTKEKRIEHEKELISLTRKHSIFGFAIGVCPEVFEKWWCKFPANDLDLYSFLLANVLSVFDNWAKSQSEIFLPSFYFESGHASSKKAAAHITYAVRERSSRYYRAPFAFVDKMAMPPLQSADLLVWLARNSMIRQVAGRAIRRDFLALARSSDNFQMYDDRMFCLLEKVFRHPNEKTEALVGQFWMLPE